MIFVVYLLLAAMVTTLSVKASQYVDLIDKKTSLSGAFIGGALLSAVTSLPELFTSLSSTVWLNSPDLCLGNILGSDLFNVAALSVVILFFVNAFHRGTISRNHSLVLLFVVLCYVGLLLNFLGILDMELLTISVTSLLIFFLYGLSMRFLAGEDSSADEEGDTSSLTLRQVVVRFVFVSIGIILTSILVTYTTDVIADKLDLGKGMAGALLLGIATSLPELSSTIALFRMGNFDIAVGNIVGSNIFNFAILAVVDVLYVGHGLYVFQEASTMALIGFGAIAMLSMLLMLKQRSRLTAVLCPLVSIGCYLGFLWMG